MSFNALQLDDWLLGNLSYIQFKNPTAIQDQTIPKILNKKSLVAISNTGTGKTASFCIPILNLLAPDPKPFFAIIIEPTRELAFQVLEQLNIFARGFNLRTALLIGGQDVNIQLEALGNSPHLVVATPGRLSYLLKESTYAFKKLKNVNFLVFDEFDQLFSSSMLPEVLEIQSATPRDVCKLFFSATFNKDILKESKTKEIIENLIKIDLTEGLDDKICKEVTQLCLIIPENQKEVTLVELLSSRYKRKYSIIFCQNVRLTCKKNVLPNC